MVTIRYDGEYKGNEYTFDKKNGFWYCSKSDNWRHRYMKAYVLLGCKLTEIAIAEGYGWDQVTKERPVVVQKAKKERKSKTPKSFIPLF